MTPARRAGRQPPKLKLCMYCNSPISDSRPPYLVTTPDNRIVGPFHAGCAERVVIAAKEIRDRKLKPAVEFGRILHVAREETLPW